MMSLYIIISTHLVMCLHGDKRCMRGSYAVNKQSLNRFSEWKNVRLHNGKNSRFIRVRLNTNPNCQVTWNFDLGNEIRRIESKGKHLLIYFFLGMKGYIGLNHQQQNQDNGLTVQCNLLFIGMRSCRLSQVSAITARHRPTMDHGTSEFHFI